MPCVSLPAEQFIIARRAFETGEGTAPFDRAIVRSALDKVRAAAVLALAPAGTPDEISVELTRAELDCWEACFTVTAEDDPEISEADYTAIAAALAAAQGIIG